MYICIIMSTRCEPFFGTTVEAVQCLTYQTEKKRSNLQKKEKKHTLVLGCVREKNFFKLSPSYAQSPTNLEKSPCPIVLQLRWVISTWWDENMTLFVFSACYEIHWNWFCGRIHFKHSEMNSVPGRCFSFGVLSGIPSNFTPCSRRRIVL